MTDALKTMPALGPVHDTFLNYLLDEFVTVIRGPQTW